MLTDKEISILALLRGISFTATVFELERTDIISKVMNSDVSMLFGQVKTEIIDLCATKGKDHVKKMFSIDDDTLKLIDESLDSKRKSRIYC